MRWKIAREAALIAGITIGIVYLIARPGAWTLAAVGGLAAAYSVIRDLWEARRDRKPPRERMGRMNRAVTGVPREPEHVTLRETRTDLVGHSEPALALPMATPARAVAVTGAFGVVMVATLAAGLLSGNWALVAIGGLASLASLWALWLGLRGRRETPAVLLTSSGLAIDRPADRVGVRWEDIDTISSFTRNNLPMIGVEAPADAVMRTGGSRLLARLNRAMSGNEFEFPALSTGAEPDALLDALANYMDDPSPLRDPARERAELTARLGGARGNAIAS
jgi:hypothetical protein